MCIIIKEMSLYWIIGLLALWSGVITAINVTAAPGVGTTTPNEFSAFNISINITNYIYNDSLEDPKSQSYKMLRRDVENLFSEIYSFSPSAQYHEIAEMTFSKGSVIASSTVLFGTNQNSGQTVKRIFVTNYQQHPSLLLDLNINYTADQEPIPVPLSLLPNISQSISSTSTTTSITSPKSQTTTELSGHIQSENESSTTSTTSASTSSDSDKLTDNKNTIPATAQTQYTTNGNDFNHFTSQTTSNSISSSVTVVHPGTIPSTMSASSPSNTTMHSDSNVLTVSSSHPLNTTVHSDSNVSTVSSSHPLNTTVHSDSNVSTVSSSHPLNTTVHSDSNVSTVSSSHPLNTTVHSESNVSTVSASRPSNTTVHSDSNISSMSASSSSAATVHPSSNISAMSASSSSVSPGKTVTQKPTGPEGTDTVATEQGVPGWGIAILVLAAIILFFMLILLILLLLFWCCWWKQRGFMNVSDPDPMGYYNPDIPMYSTHSTYDSHNGKSLDSDSDRPPKSRTGMYGVNK